jgi:hypothetical protein
LHFLLRFFTYSKLCTDICNFGTDFHFKLPEPVANYNIWKIMGKQIEYSQKYDILTTIFEMSKWREFFHCIAIFGTAIMYHKLIGWMLKIWSNQYQNNIETVSFNSHKLFYNSLQTIQSISKPTIWSILICILLRYLVPLDGDL